MKPIYSPNSVVHSLSHPAQTRLLLTLLSFLGSAMAIAAAPSPLNLAQKPLFLGGTDPNVMFLLDDSGSMDFFFMPDSVGKGTLNSNSNCLAEASMPRRLTSSYYNKLYYNPNVSYLPPMNADGTSFTESTFTGAWNNGFKTSAGTTDLSKAYKAQWTPDGTNYGTAGAKCNKLDSTGKAAYYHVFKASNTGCAINTAASPPEPNDACFDRVNVAATEQQNFANWYSFYRARMYTAKSGISRAFAQATSALYLGYGSINTSGAVARGVLPFKDATPNATDTSRSAFFTWLFARTPNGGTPLRQALESVGKYYETNAAPYNSKPWDTANGNPVSCRQSFAILMTDGYWNGNGASTDAKNDNDGTAGTAITQTSGASYTYSPSAPFQDGKDIQESNTLADVAMYYWKRDLRTGLDNNVPVGKTSIDNAFWQHMSTFTIGLGLNGTIDKTRAFNSITAASGSADYGYPTSTNTFTWYNPTTKKNQTRYGWPVPAADSENNLDDLLHAGVNGHGGFFSAGSPSEFANALESTLNEVAARQGSASTVAVNSGQLSINSVMYQASFDSGTWSGDVVAYNIDPDTGAQTVLTKASDGVPGAASRSIYTWRPAYTAANGTSVAAAGVAFTAGNLSPAQTTTISAGIAGASLDSSITVSDIVSYVRGDQSKEMSNKGVLRNRTGKIGDIINSDPVYAAKFNFGYTYAGALSTAARDAYKDFVAAQTPAIYVGANDGMLHALNGSKNSADALDELFTYVPNNVLGNLPYLAKPTDFGHKYFVDGPITVGHAYLNGSWKTILIGATGAGGKSYFALDVTNPSSPTVMWEFTHAELGNTLGRASITYLNNGKWAAVFSNGYNSTSGNAALFVLDLATGAMQTSTPLTVSSRDATRTNGLSSPAVSDPDGNGSTDLVFAGDLQGNMWKFDLSSSSPNDWAASFGGKPLFQTPLTTETSGGTTVIRRQAITTKPYVVFHPKGGLLVLFGTGKYLETGDQSNVDFQAYYGIRDECGMNTGSCSASGAAKVSLSDLLQQTFTETTATYLNATTSVSYSETTRLLSKNVDATKKGWYINLRLGTTNTGERVVSNSTLLSDRVVFASIIPNEDVCGYGGNSWIWQVDLFTGGQMPYSVFDLNRDNKFGAGDNASSVRRDGLIKGGSGVLGKDDSNLGLMNYGKSDGTTGKDWINLKSETGRQSWRQVR